MKKKFLSVILLAILIVSSVYTETVTIDAAGKNVTKTISNKEKKKMKKLLNDSPVGLFSNLHGHSKGSYNFSKAKNRRTLLHYNLTKEQAKKESTHIFGVSTGKLMEPVFGDMGCDWIEPKIKKIEKLKNGKYVIHANLVQVDTENPYYKKVMTKAKFTVKKSSKSKYGYCLKKVTYNPILK